MSYLLAQGTKPAGTQIKTHGFLGLRGTLHLYNMGKHKFYREIPYEEFLKGALRRLQGKSVRKVKIGRRIFLSRRDYWFTVMYVLTNTDVYPDDPRLKFINAARKAGLAPDNYGEKDLRRRVVTFINSAKLTDGFMATATGSAFGLRIE